MEMKNCSVNDSEICRYNNLEEISKKAEARYAELELELQKKKKYCEALEAKLNLLVKGKIAMDDMSISSEALRGNQTSGERENKKNDVDLEEENEQEDKVFQLTLEMRVLKIEKIKAESEAQVWKERFKKLESKALESGLKLANLDCHEENGKQEHEEHSHIRASLNFLQKQGKVVNLGDVASCNLLSAGTPSNEICRRNFLLGKALLHRRARTHLALEYEKSPSKKMAPCTRRGAKPTSTIVVNLTDNDEEPNISQHPMLDNQDSGGISFSKCVATEEEEKLSDNSLKGSFYGGNNEDSNSGTDVQFTAIPKRKRTQNVVTSSSESDDDNDNVPISQLKWIHDLKVPRRRLRKRLIKSQQDIKKLSCGPNEDKHGQSIPTNEETNDDESLEDVLPNNEKGSLSDFIVDDSDDTSGYEDTSRESRDASDGEEDTKSSCGPSEDKHEQSIPTNKDTDDDDDDDDDDDEESSSASEEGSLCGFIVHDSDVFEDKPSKSHDDDVSDGDVSLKEIRSQIQRKKDPKRKWKCGGDMLAAFGKDDELCMKAVCALYRQQTFEEQAIKGSLDANGRGFSNLDASRGSTLAEVLTDGDPLGDVKKSVKELEEHDSEGVEICRTLAFHYSKQLFEIYNNKEDTFLQ